MFVTFESISSFPRFVSLLCETLKKQKIKSLTGHKCQCYSHIEGPALSVNNSVFRSLMFSSHHIYKKNVTLYFTVYLTEGQTLSYIRTNHYNVYLTEGQINCVYIYKCKRLIRFSPLLVRSMSIQDLHIERNPICSNFKQFKRTYRPRHPTRLTYIVEATVIFKKKVSTKKKHTISNCM